MNALVDAALLNALLAIPLALLAAVVSRLGRRPALAHGLWLLVLLKLLTPPLFSISLPSPIRSQPPSAEAVLALPDAEADGPELPAAPLPVETAPTAERLEEPSLPSWKTVAGTVWLACAAGWFLLAGWRLVRFHRSLRFAAPASLELEDRTRRLSAAIGLARVPKVWMTVAPLSPMVWAMPGSSRLLLPLRLWEQLSEEQRDSLLLHELAHLRRGDHLVRWLELAVLGLYWWHPLAWWARRELREAEEQCCDAWVVWALPDAAPAYAAALVETAAFL